MSESGTDKHSSTELGIDNPFPGLRYFQETESAFFIGRDKEVNELVRCIKRSPLTLLFGISGLGKTSLLLAGVFPRLREEAFFPVRIRLRFYDETASFSEQVVEQVAQEAADRGIEAAEKLEIESLWEYFHRADFWDQRNSRLKPVLVFDQFEETFTLGRELADARVQPFSVELADLIENRVPKKDRRRISTTEDLPYSISEQRYRVVLTLREDYLAELEAWRRLIPSLSSNRMRLRPMNGDAAMRVVGQVPGRVSPEVAEQIVRFVANNAQADLTELEIEPSLLSVVCRELNVRRIEEGLEVITQDLLQGNRELILEGLYENCLEKVGDNRAAIRELVEEQLLTTSGLRDSVAVEDVLGDKAGITEANLAKLVDERLVRIEERSGVRRMELSHDLWTQSIVRSRDERRHTEQIQAREQARRAQLEAEKAETDARNEQLERSRRVRTVVGLALLIAFLSALYALHHATNERAKADRAREEADLARDEANRSREKAAQALFHAEKAKNEAVEKQKKLEEAARNYAPVRLALQRLRNDIEIGRPNSEIDDRLDYLENEIEAYRQNVGAREDSSADVASGDALLAALGDTEQSNRDDALQKLSGLHKSKADTVSQALALLQPPEKLTSQKSQGILAYLGETTPAIWSQELIDEALGTLGSTQDTAAQAVRAHVYLAALNNLGGERRRGYLNTMIRDYGNNSVLILEALDQLAAADLLSSSGRYATLEYLVDSSRNHQAAWNTVLKQQGCGVVKLLTSTVGKDTQKLLDSLGGYLGCG